MAKSQKASKQVKTLTSEWNQKQQHFFPHVSRSLLYAVGLSMKLSGLKKKFVKRGTPPHGNGRKSTPAKYKATYHHILYDIYIHVYMYACISVERFWLTNVRRNYWTKCYMMDSPILCVWPPPPPPTSTSIAESCFIKKRERETCLMEIPNLKLRKPPSPFEFYVSHFVSGFFTSKAGAQRSSLIYFVSDFLCSLIRVSF